MQKKLLMRSEGLKRPRLRSAGRTSAVLLLLSLAAACAPKAPPVAPGTLAHPEFMYPVLPLSLAGTPGASRVDVAWQYLQAGDLRNAELEFNVALKLGPRLYPARAGQGYLAMARREYDRALTAFDAALKEDGRYVPALVGRGQSLLALDRATQALSAFEAALAVDPSLVDLQRRVEVLRFRSLQELIDAARQAASDGRIADARLAYDRALASSPESAFLHRELGLLERRGGNTDRALAELRRAVELDPADAASLVAIGDLLDARGDLDGAGAAYRQAASIDPSQDLTAKIASVSKRALEGRLPPEFTAASTAPQITRGDLAALIGVRLEELVRRAPVSQVVMTDTQGHWAARWITDTASAGIIQPFENHTFQPGTRVRRGDLATVASRLVAMIAAADPAVRARVAQRPAIADMSPTHLQYDAVVTVVATGVMPLAADGRFQVSNQVSGAEAVDVIDRVRALAATMLGASRP
jgi:tetratricopeptide (TPR) repeat protein